MLNYKNKRSVWDGGGTLLTIRIARFCKNTILFNKHNAQLPQIILQYVI